MVKKSASEIEIVLQIDERSLSSGDFAPDRLRDVARAVLLAEGRAGHLTLVLTDDDGIQLLNRQYRGTDAPTDVLAFAAQEDAGDFITAPEATSYLGDVIISYPRAAAQARERGHPAQQEVHLLIVHGILHLLGYDHAETSEKAVMWARQDDILGHLHQSPPSHVPSDDIT